MKKGLVILLFVFVCLLVVGCGKEEKITEEATPKASDKQVENVESNKKEEYDPNNVNVLKCIEKKDENETNWIVEQSKSSYKIVKTSFIIINRVGKLYSKGYFKIWNETKKNKPADWQEHVDYYCYDEDDSEKYEQKCYGELGKDYEKITIETNGESFSSVVKSEIGLDKDTLSKLKAEYEEEGRTCTLS